MHPVDVASEVVTSGPVRRWRLVGGSLFVAIVWQFVYRRYIVVPYLNVYPPRWLHNLHLWMPDVVTTRLLGAAGLPVVFARSHGDMPVVFALVATEVLIWGALFYLLALAVIALRSSAEIRAAA